MPETITNDLKAIIGLGNPGMRFDRNRHNIGFRVLDELAQKYGVSWSEKPEALVAAIVLSGKKVILIKPQTFMNSSGKVIPMLLKQGIKSENILVVHDELEKPFGSLAFKYAGSHRGHNGLRSIIGVCGDNFQRLRCGIGRPANKEEVGDYVLSNFSESETDVDTMIYRAVGMIEELFKSV